MQDCLEAVFVADEEASQTTSSSRAKYVSTSVSDRLTWAVELHQLRADQEALGHARLGAALTQFIWKRFPATTSDAREFARVRSIVLPFATRRGP